MTNATLQTVIDTFLKSADLPTARTNLGVGAADNVQHAAVTADAYIVTSNAIITDAGTSRVLSAADNGKTIYMTANTAITVTVPAGLGAGFSCGFIQAGTGAITFVASGVPLPTLNATGGLLTTSAQHSLAAILATAANVFNVAIGGGSSGPSDGDKGDVTISGSGATYTVDSVQGCALVGAPNFLHQRNGTNAQEFGVFKSYIDGSNYGYLAIKYNPGGNTYSILSIGAGSVSQAPIRIESSSIVLDGGSLLTLQADAIKLNKDNGTNPSYIYCTGDGVIGLFDNAQTSFGRMQFGGTANTHPALKRNGASLETKLADDSAYTNHNAKEFWVTNGTQSGGLCVVPALSGAIGINGGTGAIPALYSNNVNLQIVRCDNGNLTGLTCAQVSLGALVNLTAAGSGVAQATNFLADSFRQTSSNLVSDTGTSLTLTDSHNGKRIVCTNASAITVTINNGLAAGFRCEIVQGGAGAVNVNNGTATKRSRGNLYSTNGQYAKINIDYMGTDTYCISGDRV